MVRRGGALAALASRAPLQAASARSSHCAASSHWHGERMHPSSPAAAAASCWVLACSLRGGEQRGGHERWEDRLEDDRPRGVPYLPCFSERAQGRVCAQHAG